MKFSVKELPDFSKKITITIPWNNIKENIKQELINIQKKTTMNGFRTNKVPIKIIQKKYGNTIEKNILKKIMEDNLEKIIKREKINIFKTNKIHIEKYKKSFDLIYSVNLQYIPNIDLKQLKNINIKKLLIEIDSTDIEKTIETFRKKEICWKTTTSCIKKNNKITTDISISDNQNTYHIKQFKFITCQNIIIKKVEKEFLNKKMGDKFSISIKIPQNHPDLNFQGKEIHVNINIKQVECAIKKYSKKEFIEYLTNKFQLKLKTKKNEIHSIIQENLIKEANRLSNEYFNYQIINQLNLLKIIKIPNILLEQEINIIKKSIYKEYIENKGNILELIYWKDISKQAYDQIYHFMIIQAIIYQTNIIVKKTEIQNYIHKINENSLKNIQYSQKQYHNIVNNVYNIILQNKLQNIFLKLFNIIQKKCNFQQLIKKIKKTN
ncbi:trigger factor [Buchnera aphidicola]|uniref:trigger factor n=1 Tax=Buchnera aphidicola TaxID=9 RepID=UPI00346468BB